MPKPWYYDALVSAPPYSFADWDSAKQAIPEATEGVYTIWIEEDLVYVGMSGRDDKKMLEAQKQGMPYGLIQRLKAHQSGRRSGDQFCVYVSDRSVDTPILGTVPSPSLMTHMWLPLIKGLVGTQLCSQCRNPVQSH